MTTVAEIATKKILAQLEKGTIPWRKPFNSSHKTVSMPQNLKTNTKYSGFNWLQLFCEREEKQYKSPYWLTAKQATELNGYVRKGEHGTPIIWANTTTQICCQACGKAEKKSGARACSTCKSKNLQPEQRASWRYYLVFNLDQIEGIDCPQSTERPVDWDPMNDAERFIKKSGARIQAGGDRAYYSPTFDYIQVPLKADFNSQSGYYATVLHELGHWTGHKDRMNRDFTGRFGSESYAFEELVAELTSAITCEHIGIDGEIENHASYLAGWVKILQEKPGALIEAASKATKAFDYLLDLQAQIIADVTPINTNTQQLTLWEAA